MKAREKLQPPAGEAPRKRPDPFRSALLVLAIGLVSQYAMSHGFPALGAAGYAIAIWLFLARLGAGMQPGAGGGIDWAAAQQELIGYAQGLRALKANWRRLTLAEILDGRFEPPPGRTGPKPENEGGEGP